MNLYYEEKGTGSVLILLHGNGSNHKYLAKQTTFFSKNHRVIAVDTRGHGQSPRGNGEFTLSRFADDLHTLMTDLQIDRANILGHSDGANIAMIFALRYPEKVDRLILASGNFAPDGLRLFFSLPVRIGLIFTSMIETISQKAKRKAELLRLMTDEPCISTAELQTLKQKTLIISASFDVIKESHTRLMHQCIENSVWVKIKGDHGLPHSCADAFNKTVADFLNEEKEKAYGD